MIEFSVLRCVVFLDPFLSLHYPSHIKKKWIQKEEMLLLLFQLARWLGFNQRQNKQNKQQIRLMLLLGKGAIFIFTLVCYPENYQRATTNIDHDDNQTAL